MSWFSEKLDEFERDIVSDPQSGSLGLWLAVVAFSATIAFFATHWFG